LHYRLIDELPEVIPVFPLAGALLLPEGELPLNIFEPRYLAMVGDAMAGARIIGIVQPTHPLAPAHEPPIYPIGCSGRINDYKETDDGRFLINLTGVCRFSIVHELDTEEPYRLVTAAYERYRDDIEGNIGAGIDRTALFPALRAYLDAKDLSADWDKIEQLPEATLVTSLAMACPFAPSEKQALLEAPSLTERGRLITALMEMAVLEPTESAPLQ